MVYRFFGLGEFPGIRPLPRMRVECRSNVGMEPIGRFVARPAALHFLQ
jgi:hypothetical protein